MELYFKDLISKEASLEKLVDDLSLVVHGADDFAKAVGSTLSEETRVEVAHRLNRLKENCQRLRAQAIASAKATDRWVRDYPYASSGAAFALGLLLGAVLLRKKTVDS